MSNNAKDVTASFLWFIGIVEDVKDPLQVGRLRVRIYNIHSPDRKQVPTSSLPWASVIVPVTAGALNGIGQSPTGIQEGTTVVGFFADGIEHQVPVILGCLPGLTDGMESKNDVSLLARGRDTTNKESVGPEPAPSYNAQYPYNRVLHTASGHAIEIDDTPGKERVHIYHKSGTYIEMRPDGARIDKANGKSFRISNGDDVIHVNGNASIQASGSVQVTGGSGLSISSGGAINISASGPFTVNASKINLIDGALDTDRF